MCLCMIIYVLDINCQTMSKVNFNNIYQCFVKMAFDCEFRNSHLMYVQLSMVSTTHFLPVLQSKHAYISMCVRYVFQIYFSIEFEMTHNIVYLEVFRFYVVHNNIYCVKLKDIIYAHFHYIILLSKDLVKNLFM